MKHNPSIPRALGKGVFALVAILLLTPITPLAPLAQSVQAQEDPQTREAPQTQEQVQTQADPQTETQADSRPEYLRQPSRFVPIPYMLGRSIYKNIPDSVSRVSFLRKYLESIPSVDPLDIEQICVFNVLFNGRINAVRNLTLGGTYFEYGRDKSFECEPWNGGLNGIAMVEMRSADAAQAVVREITKKGVLKLEYSRLNINHYSDFAVIADGWNLVYCYFGISSPDVDKIWHHGRHLGESVPFPEGNLRVLEVFKWGEEQNLPESYGVISLKRLLAAYQWSERQSRSSWIRIWSVQDMPEELVELQEIPPHSFLAIYVSDEYNADNQQMENKSGEQFVLALRC